MMRSWKRERRGENGSRAKVRIVKGMAWVHLNVCKQLTLEEWDKKKSGGQNKI